MGGLRLWGRKDFAFGVSGFWALQLFVIRVWEAQESFWLRPSAMYLCLLKAVFIYHLAHLCASSVLFSFSNHLLELAQPHSTYGACSCFIVLLYLTAVGVVHCSFCFPYPPALCSGLGLFVPTPSMLWELHHRWWQKVSRALYDGSCWCNCLGDQCERAGLQV